MNSEMEFVQVNYRVYIPVSLLVVHFVFIVFRIKFWLFWMIFVDSFASHIFTFPFIVRSTFLPFLLVYQLKLVLYIVFCFICVCLIEKLFLLHSHLPRFLWLSVSLSPLISYICAHSDLSSERRLQWEKFTRYATYFGLCIATCLTFKSSTWIASAIGVAVAAYISISEYWLSSNPQQAQGPQSLEQLFQQQAHQEN